MHLLILGAMPIYVWVILLILCLIAGCGIGYFIRLKMHEKSFAKTKQASEKIISDAEVEAEKRKRESILEAKQEIADLKADADKDIRERKSVVVELENKLNQREDSLDRRSSNLDRREEMLNAKETKIDEKKSELEQQNIKVEAILKQQEQKLIEIGNLTRDEAKKIIMDSVRANMKLEIASYIKEEEEKAKLLNQ